MTTQLSSKYTKESAVFCHLTNAIVDSSILVPLEVLTDDNGDIKEELGVAYCSQFADGLWLQTFLDGSARKNYAGIGYSYDEEHDAFIPPKPPPVESETPREWVLNMETFRWVLTEV